MLCMNLRQMKWGCPPSHYLVCDNQAAKVSQLLKNPPYPVFQRSKSVPFLDG